MSKAHTRMERLQKIRRLLLEHEGLKAEELLEFVDVNRATVFRDLKTLGTVSDRDGVHHYVPAADEQRMARLVLQAAQRDSAQSTD